MGFVKISSVVTGRTLYDSRTQDLDLDALKYIGQWDAMLENPKLDPDVRARILRLKDAATARETKEKQDLEVDPLKHERQRR